MQRTEQLAELLQIRQLWGSLFWSRDGRYIYFVSDQSGQRNLWRVDALSGRQEPVTSFEKEAVRMAQLSPDGSHLLLAVDVDGDEAYQIWLQPSGGGPPVALTDRPDVQHLTYGPWSPCSRYVAYSANARTPDTMDLWVQDVQTRESTLVYADGRNYYPMGWTPDGRKIIAVELRSNADTNIVLVDVATRRLQLLTPHEGEVFFWPGPIVDGGRRYYLTTDQGRDFTFLAIGSLETGAFEPVAVPEWDVEAVLSVSESQRYLAWCINEGGVSRVFVLDRTTGVSAPLEGIPEGCVWSLRFGPREQLALSLSHPRGCDDIWVADVTTGRIRQVTNAMPASVDVASLVAPRQVCAEAADGAKTPAWLYLPHGHGESQAPVVMVVHGGPEAQERPSFQPFYQYLLSHGVAVLAPNIRGSTGYGTRYQRMIQGQMGRLDLLDLEACARYLARHPHLDPGRMAVMGDSYGGFATLTCLTRLPEYWACGVALFAPANLLTFVQTTQPTWRRYMEQLIGDPAAQEAELLSRSPISHAANVRAPLLLIQGQNDVRVPISESQQFVDALAAHGKSVEYVVYPDEGHGFVRPENQLDAYRRISRFLFQHLLRR